MSINLVEIDLRDLEDGEPQVLCGTLPPESLELDHQETQQFSAVTYKLEAQLFAETLVLKIDLQGEKKTPCKICNHEFSTPIFIEKERETLSLDEIEGYKVNLTPTIRNLFLLEDPGVLECNEGACSDRQEVEKILNQNRLSIHPFDNLS